MSLIIGQQGQRAALTRSNCPGLNLKSRLGFLVEILLKSSVFLYISFSELNTLCSHDSHEDHSLPPARGKAMFWTRVLKSEEG